jgi:hypothetical protein
MALAYLHMADHREDEVTGLDVVGVVLVGIGSCGLILGFEAFGDGLLPRWASLGSCLLGLASIALYLRHARRARSPILDLSLLKVPTFFAGVVGGGLFRIGIGAIPFLLPLMLQAGFGYSPLASGMTTLAAAAGAVVMKFGAQRLIRSYGFRQTLIWNSLFSAVSLAACMFFTPGTPAALIFVVLLTGGFFRSLTFTALNTIAYADLEQGSDERGDRVLGRGAAALAVSWGRPRRDDPESGPGGGQRAFGRRFHLPLRGDRGIGRTFGGSVCDAVAGRRKRGGRPNLTRGSGRRVIRLARDRPARTRIPRGTGLG